MYFKNYIIYYVLSSEFVALEKISIVFLELSEPLNLLSNSGRRKCWCVKTKTNFGEKFGVRKTIVTPLVVP